MSIQWADDFSRYGTGSASRTAMLDGLPYANIATIGTLDRGTVQPDPSPTVSGRAFLLPAGAAGSWQNQFRIALPTVISGTGRVLCRLWQDQLPASNNERPTIGFQRGDGTMVAYMLIEQNGSVTLRGLVGGVDTQVADTINPVTTPAAWQHYEFAHNRATGAGSLRINGIERLTWTGIDTASNLEFVQITAASGNTNGQLVYVKDLVIADSTGSVNNGNIGTVIVKRIKPNADNTLGGWSPSTGTTGFNLLAKDAVNDSTFLSGADSPLPAAMVFGLENLPADVTSVRGLISVTRARKVDGGDGNLQDSLSPNGVNWDVGADRPITSAFQYDFDVSELDPATSSPWSPTAVDSALLRINRTV